MKVAVLGNTGMLGHMVQSVLRSEDRMSVNGYGRESLDVVPRTLNQLGTKMSNLLGFDTDYVINCIGAIKPTFEGAIDPSVQIYTNAVFPHQLATWGGLTNTKIIHITTDCVYDGEIGGYHEDDAYTANDLYGMSKALGEPKTQAMVIRTSIIGPEFGGRKRSFLEWLKGARGGEVNGFTNHYWNGLTTFELANGLAEIIDYDVWEPGLYHVYSSDVSKLEMVEVINDIYELGLAINPVEAPTSIDRTLRTNEDLNDWLQPKGFTEMVIDMCAWEEVYGQS